MKKETSYTGISLTGTLLAAFIIMKLARVGAVADWSWWWVLSPLWIHIGLILSFGLVALLFFYLFKK